MASRVTHAPPGPTSYLTAANLATGLARVQRMAPGSRLLNLRIDATSLDAEVAEHGGGAKEISLAPSGNYDMRPEQPGLPSFPFSDVRPAVVPRLLGELERRFHVHRGRVRLRGRGCVRGRATVLGPVPEERQGRYIASISGAGSPRLVARR